MAFYTSGACEINWYWLDWLGIKSWLFVHNFYYEYYITPYHITNAPSADCFHYNNGNNSTWPYLLRMQTNRIGNISFLSIIWKHLWLIIIGQRKRSLANNRMVIVLSETSSQIQIVKSQSAPWVSCIAS